MSIRILIRPMSNSCIRSRRLQTDLNRAEITPEWWGIYQSLYATATTDKVLKRYD